MVQGRVKTVSVMNVVCAYVYTQASAHVAQYLGKGISSDRAISGKNT